MRGQLRSLDIEIFNKNRDCEDSRQEQSLLVAETRSRERAHQEARIHILQDVEELKHVSCSRAELPQEACAVSLSTRKRVQREDFGRATPSLSTTFFMVEQPRNIISEFGPKITLPSTFQCLKNELQEECVLVPVTLLKQRVGLKKSRWLL